VNMATPNIFDKRLLIISGKGGVGKSTICSALALAASRMDKQILIVEMDEREVADIFGKPQDPSEGSGGAA